MKDTSLSAWVFGRRIKSVDVGIYVLLALAALHALHKEIHR